jgi:hypothetical protein
MTRTWLQYGPIWHQNGSRRPQEWSNMVQYGINMTPIWRQYGSNSSDGVVATAAATVSVIATVTAETAAAIATKGTGKRQGKATAAAPVTAIVTEVVVVVVVVVVAAAAEILALLLLLRVLRGPDQQISPHLPHHRSFDSDTRRNSLKKLFVKKCACETVCVLMFCLRNSWGQELSFVNEKNLTASNCDN